MLETGYSSAQQTRHIVGVLRSTLVKSTKPDTNEYLQFILLFCIVLPLRNSQWRKVVR